MERVGIEALGAVAFFVTGGLLWPRVVRLFWSEEKKLAAKADAEVARIKATEERLRKAL